MNLLPLDDSQRRYDSVFLAFNIFALEQIVIFFVLFRLFIYFFP